MNFVHPRSKVFILAIFFSGHPFAQDATSALEKDKQAVLVRAIDIALNAYSDTKKNALSMIAMTRNCFKSYPQLKGKLRQIFLLKKVAWTNQQETK